MSYLELAKQIAAGLVHGSTTSHPGPVPSRHLCVSDAGFGAAVTTLVAMPLDVFEAEGSPLEVRVPWWPETLWLVPAAVDARQLETEGVARYRAWTARELLHLLSAVPLTSEALTVLTITRRDFDGEIVSVHHAAPKPA